MKRLTHSQSVRLDVLFFATLVCLTTLGLAAIPASVSADSNDSTRSTNIALTQGGHKLVAVNTDSNSVTVFAVKGGGGSLTKLAEISVGREPHCVAVKGNNRAFVTIAQSGSVWVINLNTFKVTEKIDVGTEPRGCALAPNGSLYVANHTEGTVSVINTNTSPLKVSDTIEVGGNPFAIAIDKHRVFVTQFYARLIEDGDDKGEGFDDQKEGVVQAFRINNPGSIAPIPLSPLPDSGFTADRKQLLQQHTSGGWSSRQPDLLSGCERRPRRSRDHPGSAGGPPQSTACGLDLRWQALPPEHRGPA